MLNQKPVEKVIFIDVETTSQKASFVDLSDEEKFLFMERFKKDIEMDIDEIHKKHKSKEKKFLEKMENMYDLKAPLFPEFGKIICVSVGIMWETTDNWHIKTTSFSSDNEIELLNNLVSHEKLSKIWSNVPGKWEKDISGFYSLCAHNGFVFDYPYIAKRLIINGILPPPMFDFAHLKPWEISFLIDTKKEWGFGVFDGAVSLKLLCHVFNVPTPKDDIDGSDVKRVFWKENDLPRIVKYCEKDVVALAQVYLKMKCIKKPIKIYEEPKIEAPKTELAKEETTKAEPEDSSKNNE